MLYQYGFQNLNSFLKFFLGVRHSLARKFDACIEAKKCRGKCTHKYQKVGHYFLSKLHSSELQLVQNLMSNRQRFNFSCNNVFL